jgi:Ca2+-binding RTX toxin-like protein
MANVYDGDLGNVRSELITNAQSTKVIIDRELETLNFTYLNGSKRSVPLPFSDQQDWMGYAFWLAGNDNNFLLVYNGERANGGEVLGQLFDYNGDQIGGEIIFSTQTNQGHRPSAWVLSDGRYMILWQTNNPLGSPELGDRVGYVVGRILSLDNIAMGDTFVVATGINLLVDAPTIQLTGTGYIKVTLNARTNVSIPDEYFTSYGTVSNDVINGSDQPESIFSGNGNDTVNGLAGNDYIDGGKGNDVISGGLGDDTMVGGSGDDKYIVDSIEDIVKEELNAGVDTVLSNLSSFSLGDNLENLILGSDALYGTGNKADNAIQGNSQNNKLDGGFGKDTIDGGAGSDQIDAGDGNDKIAAGDGDDDVIGGAGNDIVTGGLGNDTILTGDGNDIVDAGAGDDFIVGGDGAGDDTYNGGVGIDTVKYTSATAAISVNLSTGTAKSLIKDNARIGSDKLSNIENVIAGNYSDTITGSKVSNILTGGFGNDTFVFNSLLNGTTNVDTITDFTSGSDKIALSKSIFKAFSKDKTVAAEKLVNGDRAIDANDYLVYDKATGKLYYDADGNEKGGQVQIALIGTDTALTATDFTII